MEAGRRGGEGSPPNPNPPRMAEWLKQQAEREAEKEQQRAERLQRRLREPEHRFSDAAFQQQCHQLAERLEDSVIKGGAAITGPAPYSGPAPNHVSSCSRSAGQLQRTGEGRPRPHGHEAGSGQRAARQEEEDGRHLLVG